MRAVNSRTPRRLRSYGFNWTTWKGGACLCLSVGGRAFTLERGVARPPFTTVLAVVWTSWAGLFLAVDGHEWRLMR